MIDIELLSNGIRVLASGGASSGSSDWVRPSDWTALPTDAANTIVLTAGVWDNDSNFCALNVTLSTGTYSVDWGDGTSSTGVASGANAEHQYTYADGDLSAATTEGFKVAIITVTTSGGNITNFNLSTKHTQSGLGSYSQPWLDARINAPSATAMTIRGSSQECRLLRYINFTAIGGLTTLANAFYNCSALQSVSFPSGSLASVTTLASAFYSCSALQSVSFPSGSLASVTTLASAFLNCFSIESVSFPSGSLAGVTTLAYAFYSCPALQSVSFPSGSLASVTILDSAFLGCYSLRSVSFPSGSLASVTTLANAFQSCFSIESVSFPSGSLAGVTTLASAFLNCSALQSVSFPSGSLASVTTLANAFQGCYSLRSVSFPSGWNPTGLTTTTNVFTSSTSLANVDNCAIPVSFSVASSNLGPDALDEIYTSLPTVSNQTITVTNNWGTASDDPTIATAKGWTVTS